ncbi:MAG: GntR family transcriptional regulator [Meiothermus sp.]|nr:GntR family transcriptional regulator [Meiothermus sp.]
MELNLIQNQTRVVDTVRGALRDAILEGRLAPGQKLSVPELSRQLGVSRSPVREAILQLVAEGLAVELPRRGVLVAEFGLQDVAHIFEVREALEVASVRLGAGRATRDDLEALRKLLEEQALQVKRNDLEGYQQTDLHFHKLLGSLSHNPVMERHIGLLKDQSRLALENSARSIAQLERGHAEHVEILAALKARDGERAAEVLLRHFERIRASLGDWLSGR